jgi:hypothetical protein
LINTDLDEITFTGGSSSRSSGSSRSCEDRDIGRINASTIENKKTEGYRVNIE